MVDGRTPEHGYTISLPREPEPNVSGEQKMPTIVEFKQLAGYMTGIDNLTAFLIFMSS